ncbi:acyl-CoA synthetase [Patulibacter brassicae]|jgi:fatty-acyl-CoA synthase|uniref:Acyl-CoA synthetase n=1 Tax=Patulibacter brassicae TaxID=1705717 RepID=A0ABU4VP94_9ACTN|nr:acyl-CoA synthetase [Patulibacter brassicae]MDX8153685.1 acyl-CoA synthetase [Patulibacter brassicae]
MTPSFPSTISDLVRRSAARVPDRVALHAGPRSWTYRALDEAVSRVAARLLGLGLVKGDRVAGYGRNSDAYVLLFLGCARAGLVHVPVNYNVAGEELRYLVGQPECAAVFVDPSLSGQVDAIADGLPAVRHRGTLRDGDGGGAGDVLAWATAEGPVPAVVADVRDADLAQLLFTSGTTSAPKGAMMTHRALVHEYVSCIVALDLDERDVPVHALPLYHSAQMHVFLVPYLALGATAHLVEAPDPADLLERVERDGITSLFAPPTVWIALGEHPDFRTRDLGTLTKAYYGASIMPVPVLQRLREALPGVGFYNAFGQSEIGPLATVLRPEEHDARPDAAGRPVLFVELRVVDEEGRDVADGELGECIYRSPQLCTGYWGKPEATAEAFRDGWFRSGDLVRRDAEGYVFVVDRVKDVINTGGVLVASREVEEALYTHPAVAEVAVIATPHERWIEAITAVVVLREGAAPDALIAHAKEHLAPFKVPKAVHVVDVLPKNPSGKLLKRELRERFSGDGSAVAR